MSIPQDLSWFIGLIGFSYPEWSKTLYAEIDQIRGSTKRSGKHRLSQYATHFNSVEINTTFYGVPSIKTVQTWADATPANFRFCVKMPRDVTHGPTPAGSYAAADGPPFGHLLREETFATVLRFVETMQPLRSKLGAVLLQFPPKFRADRRDELGVFLHRLRGLVPLAVELRHESWWTPETEHVLHECGVCWVGSDEASRRDAEHAPSIAGSPQGLPRLVTPTADFLYVRWLGKHGQFDDRSKEHFDPTPRLRWWAERIGEVLERNPQIRTVYGFFDNDFAGHAPATARRFVGVLGFPVASVGRPKPSEPTLFG